MGFATAHVLACWAHAPRNDPEANPYLVHYAITLLFLVAGFVAWRRRRPRPRRALRILAGSASLFAFVLAAVQSVTIVDAYRTDLLWILQACVFVTGTLYLEMLLAPRRARVPKARALR